MFERIVLAVDGSQHSQRALVVARSLAETYGARILLVHAYPHTSDLRGAEEYGNLVSRRKSAGQELLTEARNQIGDKAAEIEEDLLEGPAAEAILKVARIRKADLIIMGTRGKGSLEGLVFGSVSSKITHYAACTVMVVR